MPPPGGPDAADVAVATTAPGSSAAIKQIVLAVLVIQNGSAVLLMRAVRALPGEKEFVTLTAVIMQELLKAVTCVALILWSHGSLAVAWEKPSESLKTSVPALLYLVQNNLQYVAVGLLDAPTYAVTYQTKMIWVAICSVLLLGKHVERHQWIALAILLLGVCLVQFDQSDSISAGSPTSVADRILGLAILLVAALCSSLAAVSFEKLLKCASADLWTRNLQLAFFSLVCSVAPLLASADGAKIRERGFFQGYTKLTWACILMNGGGGLLVGAVIKHADAIMKDIAIGASICVSAVGSVILFSSSLSAYLLLGILLVSWAVPMYAGRVDFKMLLLQQSPELARAPEEQHGSAVGKPFEDGEEVQLTLSEVSRERSDSSGI